MSLYGVRSASAARKLISEGHDVTGIHYRDDTPLHTAKSFAIAKVLLDAGADPHATNRSGHTPIVSAIKKGNIKWVKHMMTLDVVCTSDMLKMTNKLSIIQVLLAKITNPSPDALNYHLEQQNHKIVEVLIDHQSQIDDQSWQYLAIDHVQQMITNGFQLTVELYPVLVRYDRIDMVQFLQSNGIYPSTTNTYNPSSLMMTELLNHQKPDICYKQTLVQAVSYNQLDQVSEILQGEFEPADKLYEQCQSIKCFDLLVEHDLIQEGDFCVWACENRKLDFLQCYVEHNPVNWDNVFTGYKIQTNVMDRNTHHLLQFLVQQGVTLKTCFDGPNYRFDYTTEEGYQFMVQHWPDYLWEHPTHLFTQTETIDMVMGRFDDHSYELGEFYRGLIKHNKLELVNHTIKKNYLTPDKFTAWQIPDFWSRVKTPEMVPILLKKLYQPNTYTILENNVLAEYFLSGMSNTDLAKILFNVCYTSVKKIAKLLEYGLDINSIYTWEKPTRYYSRGPQNGDNILTYYLRRKDHPNYAIVKFLLDNGINVNHIGPYKKMPLDYALDVGIAQLLMNYGAFRSGTVNKLSTRSKSVFKNVDMMTKSDYFALIMLFRSWWIKKQMELDVMQACQIIIKPDTQVIWNALHLLSRLPSHPTRIVLEML